MGASQQSAAAAEAKAAFCSDISVYMPHIHKVCIISHIYRLLQVPECGRVYYIYRIYISISLGVCVCVYIHINNVYSCTTHQTTKLVALVRAACTKLYTQTTQNREYHTTRTGEQHATPHHTSSRDSVHAGDDDAGVDAAAAAPSYIHATPHRSYLDDDVHDNDNGRRTKANNHHIYTYTHTNSSRRQRAEFSLWV